MTKRRRIAQFYGLNVWRPDEWPTAPLPFPVEEEWWGGVALPMQAARLRGQASVADARAGAAFRKTQLQDEVPAGNLYGQAPELFWQPPVIPQVIYKPYPLALYEQNEPAGSLHGPPEEPGWLAVRPWVQRPAQQPLRLEDDLPPQAVVVALEDGARLISLRWPPQRALQPRLVEDDLPVPAPPALVYEDYAWPPAGPWRAYRMRQAQVADEVLSVLTVEEQPWQPQRPRVERRTVFRAWADEVITSAPTPPDEGFWLPPRPWARRYARGPAWPDEVTVAPPLPLGIDEDFWLAPQPWPIHAHAVPPWLLAAQDYTTGLLSTEQNVGASIHAIPSREAHAIPRREAHAVPARDAHKMPGRKG